MIIKSFKHFLFEEIQRAEAESLYSEFKSKMESKYKERHPNQSFVVNDTDHITTRIIQRSISSATEQRNVLITKEEMSHIFDVVYERFFRLTTLPETPLMDSDKDLTEGKVLEYSGGVDEVTSPNSFFLLKPTKEWVIQHKIFIGEEKKNFRCIVYSVKLDIGQSSKPNKKGKYYDVVKAKTGMNLITVLPSNRDGIDSPMYQYTTEIREALEQGIQLID